MSTTLMSTRDFQKITDAGYFARRESPIRAIDDLLARYPDMSNFLKSLAAFRMIEYCDEFIKSVKNSKKPSKRASGVNILRGQADEAYKDLVQLAKVQNRFRKLMHNPKFKKLGQLQTKAMPQAKVLDDEVLLEALDDLHRAGHGLHSIHDKWAKSTSNQNFWDFMDQYLKDNPQEEPYRVKYLDENERRAFEVRVVGGQLIQGYGDETHTFDTAGMAVSSPRVENIWGWGIFVYGMDKKIYSGGSFSNPVPNPDGSGEVDYWKSGDFMHHSTFLGGAAVLCAGEWFVAPGGHLVCITPRSGHYRPPVDLFKSFLVTLRQKGIMLDRTAVAWPWPQFNDRVFYNAQDFLHADDVVFLKEPKNNGVALEQLTSMHNPLNYVPQQQPAPQQPPPQQPNVQNAQNNGAQQPANNGPYANGPRAGNVAPPSRNAGRPLPNPPVRPLPNPPVGPRNPYGQPIPAQPVSARAVPGRLDPSRLAAFQNG